MNETIDIPINYNGEQLIFTAQIISFGYTYRLSVDVNGNEVFFEPDEQNQYRAVLVTPDSKITKADKEIIAALSAVLSAARE